MSTTEREGRIEINSILIDYICTTAAYLHGNVFHPSLPQTALKSLKCQLLREYNIPVKSDNRRTIDVACY